MRWYKHDANAAQDAKIRKLIIKHGAVGYAVYFHCLELIAGNVSETNITFALEHDAEIIADNLRITGDAQRSGADVVSEIMAYMVQLKLFESSAGHIYCYKMLKRIDATMLSSSSRMRALIAEAKDNYTKTMAEPWRDHGATMAEPPLSHGETMAEPRLDHGGAMAEPCYTRIDYTRLDNNTPDDGTSDKPEPTSKRFTKPTLDEVASYCAERHNCIDPQAFLDYYEARDWRSGNSRIKDWRACIRTWEANDRRRSAQHPPRASPETQEPPALSAIDLDARAMIVAKYYNKE
jgi:hypothetical protein